MFRKFFLTVPLVLLALTGIVRADGFDDQRAGAAIEQQGVAEVVAKPETERLLVEGAGANDIGDKHPYRGYRAQHQASPERSSSPGSRSWPKAIS